MKNLVQRKNHEQIQLFNKINKANQNNKVDRYQKNHYPLINQNKTQLVFCIFLYLNIKKSVIK